MDCIDISGGGAKGPQNFIFGYGSLVEDESRQRTTPSARDAWPARVKGVRRGWWARGAASGLTTTYLGAISDPTAVCNGVIYKVSAEDLAATDIRESAGYQRCRIETSQIKMLDGRTTPLEGLVWAYINLIPPNRIAENLATPQFPIVQSYVDICIHGCLEVEGKYPTAAGFTQDFIATTDEWNRFWVNDRLYPRRPFIFQPAAGQIDAALQKAPKTAELFYEVEIEPAGWEDRKPVRPKVT
jgi:Gamma-glutamyl cyclotransferase, AIG2-like